jgi:hypothetical protein
MAAMYSPTTVRLLSIRTTTNDDRPRADDKHQYAINSRGAGTMAAPELHYKVENGADGATTVRLNQGERFTLTVAWIFADLTVINAIRIKHLDYIELSAQNLACHISRENELLFYIY